MPVAGGGTWLAPSLAFSRKTAIWARVTEFARAVVAAAAAAGDAVVEEVLDEAVELVRRRHVGEAVADVQRPGLEIELELRSSVNVASQWAAGRAPETVIR